MANKAIVSSKKITAIANAIRSKTGNSDLMSLDDMPAQIEAIETGGGSSSGIQKVAYIQFTGDQAIETGIMGNQDTKIIATFTMETTTSCYLFNVGSTNNVATISGYLSNAGGFWRFGAKYVQVKISTNQDFISTFILSKKGVEREYNTNGMSGVTDFETVNSIVIGGQKTTDGTISSIDFIGKLFLFEIWQGGELALKLVPARDENGNYGFLDEVSGTFFTSVNGIPLSGGFL